MSAGRRGPPWTWAAVALLLAVHAALLLHGGLPRPRAEVWALLPLLPLDSGRADAELAAAGLLLPEDPGAVDPEAFGSSLARRLGKTAWLGPTLAVDDFAQGLAALAAGEGPGLDADAQARIREPLAALEGARADLARSERTLLDLAARQACARAELLAALEPAEREALLVRLAGPGGAP